MSTVMTKADFDRKVDTFLLRWRASLISGRRTDAHSVKVGGFAGDPHSRGFGADCEYDEPVPTVDVVVEYANMLGLLLLREHHANGDHLQPLDWQNE